MLGPVFLGWEHESDELGPGWEAKEAKAVKIHGNFI